MIIQNRISKPAIDSITPPKRICFNSTHKNALKRSQDRSWVGVFNIPFLNSIYPILHKETNIILTRSKYGYWVPLKTESEYNIIANFVENKRELVFLKDTLALSIALAENFDQNNQRTEIGYLENHAKYWGDEEAMKRLSYILIETINTLPYYKDVEYFCAVPSSDNNESNLPTNIVEYLSEDYRITNITPHLRWRNEKGKLKELPKDAKWEALEEADLIVETDLSGKTVILIDDLYQSGITLQYIAMKLISAGADKIFGACLVKSRRDSDNI